MLIKKLERVTAKIYKRRQGLNMSLNETPSGERIHIAFFGCRNAGKSSLLNAVTGQNIAIVSDVLGTTTDPVYKAIELLPAGPVMIIDTPGLDDVGLLGHQRIDSTEKILRKTDIAVLVVDSNNGLNYIDNQIIDEFKKLNIPYIIAWNKIDLNNNEPPENVMPVSASDNIGIFELKEKIAKLANNSKIKTSIVGEFVEPGDIVVLVIPIDKAAPKGRLILPQQQTIRDLLDHSANAVVCTNNQLKDTLNKLKSKPKLVITDSQVFSEVLKIVPEDVLLTSFSILFSKYKGNLKTQLNAIKALDNLKDGDTVLISEGCSHHRQCGDIGTEKIPGLLSKIANLNVEFTSGNEFSNNLSKYKLIIHCGACMLNIKEMQSRIIMANKAKVPITNYGMFLAKMNGTLNRSIKIFEQNV